MQEGFSAEVTTSYAALLLRGLVTIVGSNFCIFNKGSTFHDDAVSVFSKIPKQHVTKWSKKMRERRYQPSPSDNRRDR